MLQSQLKFSAEYVDQPAAVDSLERLTSAQLQISIGRHIITRAWDKQTGNERPHIFVPTLPIAEWIVKNWWALLYEPCRSQLVPVGEAVRRQLPWVKRHNFRSADSSLSLPSLYLFSDGELVGMQWISDNEDGRPNMPIEFLEQARQYLPREETTKSLGQFVSSVIRRVESDQSARARHLIEHWNAIQAADEDQVNFCVLAGCMGLDPYDPEETTDEVAEAICSLEEDACTPVIRDLTEVTSPEFVLSQWKWVQEASDRLNLGGTPGAVQQGASLPTLDRSEMPHRFGYELASFVRDKAALPESTPISDIETLAILISGKPLRMEERNHMPDREVRAIVGWTGSDGAIVACPDYGKENSRFLLARGLFHALCLCDVGRRLITHAFTWDQKAGRSFAAELLAPRQVLASRTGDRADGGVIEQLAREYRVSTIVVENQLENAGVEIIRE